MRQDEHKRCPNCDMPFFTGRQREVLHWMGQALKMREIAKKMFICSKAVYSHQAKLKEKLGLKTNQELYKYAALRAANDPSVV
jgi:DNA-binding NarL/FixJ family response regulator